MDEFRGGRLAAARQLFELAALRQGEGDFLSEGFHAPIFAQ
jgi:hypothetical protein